MAYIDSFLEFMDATDVSASTGTALVGNVVDLGLTGLDIGTGQPIYLVIQVTTAFTSGTTSTIQFQLASDASATIATDGTATAHWISDDFADTDLVKGYQLVVPVPSRQPDFERYLGILVTTGNAATTAGAVNAFLTMDPPAYKAYPDATN